ncbi:MAG: hypothetical protein HFE86_02060 [Clostridiales bacterium]|nr:hypothetical protein [Clostridiales bacterium]
MEAASVMGKIQAICSVYDGILFHHGCKLYCDKNILAFTGVFTKTIPVYAILWIGEGERLFFRRKGVVELIYMDQRRGKKQTIWVNCLIRKKRD